MFQCELRFNQAKAEDMGYSADNLYKTVDKIMVSEGLKKVKEGLYVDETAETNKHTVRLTYLLAHCPQVVHFCNYLDITDPIEGSEGNIACDLEKYRQYVKL